MRAKIRDTEIYFDVEGAGLVTHTSSMYEKLVMFVVHGGPGADHTSHRASLAPLTQQLQIVYFDHRGQGRSARGDKKTYTLDNNVEDMEALRQHLGLDKIVVMGTSYGGMVALTYAIRYPQNVSHLILVATAASYEFLAKAKENLAEKGTSEQQEIAKYLWEGNFVDEEHLHQYFQVMGSMYSLNYNPEKAQSDWHKTILSVDAINVAFSTFLRTYDVRKDLPKITAPTLVIGGRHDWICSPEFSQEIAQGIPNSQLLIMEKSGHSVRADQPEELRKTITNWLPSINH